MDKTVLTSDGQTTPALSTVLEINDFLGRKCQMTYQTDHVATPYGPRFQTTVYLYPSLDDNGKGQKAVYVGTTIQAPGDTFSYDAGMEWALFRAAENMLDHSGDMLSFLQRFDYNNWRIEKFLHRWARSVLRRMYFNKQAPIQAYFASLDLEQLKAEVQKGNF